MVVQQAESTGQPVQLMRGVAAEELTDIYGRYLRRLLRAVRELSDGVEPYGARHADIWQMWLAMDDVALFEATHGTAPKYAGQDKVNPSSVLLSGVMMFQHLGWTKAAADIERAIAVLDEVLTELE